MEKILTEWPPWLHVAVGEIDVHEIPGKKHEPRIIQYNATTTLNAKEDEVPWCSSFVNWCVKKSDIAGTNLANARSWLKWGVGIFFPAFGCITILRRGDSNFQGHVGFFVGFDGKDRVKILGGNQSDKVCIQSYPKNHVLGYRWV